jgi:hypothetical protein
MKALQIIARIVILCAMLFVVGCAHHEDNHYTPPSVVEVQRNFARVAPHIRPEGKSAYIDLQKSITDYQAQVEKQTALLAKAEADAVYWNQKHFKALKELWIWRSIAIVSIVCVVAYIGIKTSWKFLI